MFEQLKYNIADWFEERLKISGLKKMLGKKVVPQHEHTLWYYTGGMAMFFFILQVATGLLLMVYYQPGLETSYESVKYITEKVPFGELIRSIHSWAANLMIGLVFIHMFAAYFMKAYRRPRELTWLTGFGLFALSLGLGFSGYLLAWDELAFFATKVGLQIMSQTPVVGATMADLLRGGSDVGGSTISRFFELHVILLPLAVMGLLGAHLVMVQLHGMSTPESYRNKPARHQKSIPFFTDFLYHDIFIWTLMLGGVVLLASTNPWPLGPKADPFAPAPEGIKPEWYFMFMFQILKLIPAHVGPLEGEVFGILMFGAAGALWALVPFWEPINRWTRRLATAYGVLAVVVIVGATIVGYMPPPGKPMAAASGGSVMMAGAGSDTAEIFKQNCAACHSIGGGALVGPDLKNVTQNRDREQLANFIVDPTGSAMPVIEGIDKATADALLVYIDEQSDPSKAKQAAATEEALPPMTEADVEKGRQLFMGTVPFAKGGTSCLACHGVKGAGPLGGGTLGPDLSDAYRRLGEQKGLEAWLGSIPSKTMKPIYKDRPLTQEEIHALTAYLASVSSTGKATPTETTTHFPLAGFLGLLAVMAVIGIVFSGRFRGVRRPLVEGETKNNKENDIS